MKVGIVGLPNVGKSTLFNALTKMSVLEANYPFATITPNIGKVSIIDDRLKIVSNIFQSKNIVFANVEFIDIAGLVEGASKGEGLGNQFLNHIKNVDAICHVVKCFRNPNILHVRSFVDPLKEINIINSELAFSDLNQIERRLLKIKKKSKIIKEKNILLEVDLLNKIKNCIELTKNINSLNFNLEELKIIKNLNLLSFKPMLYIANITEEDLTNPENNDLFQQILVKTQKEKKILISACISFEKDIAFLNTTEKKNFLKIYGLKNSILHEIIKKSYDLLGLKTYFTAGIQETKAWSFMKGMNALECANIIHSDFKKGFIKAEILSYEDLLIYKTFQNAKNKGKVRLEGKEYIVQDADIITFRFNV